MVFTHHHFCKYEGFFNIILAGAPISITIPSFQNLGPKYPILLLYYLPINFKPLIWDYYRCTYMAASGLVQEDPDHIFVMMQFLFDIKKVCLIFVIWF